jgi:hypothetical protein
MGGWAGVAEMMLRCLVFANPKEIFVLPFPLDAARAADLI